MNMTIRILPMKLLSFHELGQCKINKGGNFFKTCYFDHSFHFNEKVKEI